MDIYPFIPSRDVALYCSENGHVFNSLEMAVIVAISGKSMKEKLQAWRKIVSDYPDMPIPVQQEHPAWNPVFESRESLHGYLRELIAREEKSLSGFYSAGGGSVYYPTVQRNGSGRHSFREHGDMGVFRTAEKAWDAIVDNWSWDEDRLKSACISKAEIDGDIECRALFNSDGEVVRIWGERHTEHLDCLKDVFVYIPMPFEKGDVVEFEGRPYVLSKIPERADPEDIPAWLRRYGAHSLAHFYSFEGSQLLWDHGPPAYYQVEFFRGELKGRESFLKYLSHYIKSNEQILDNESRLGPDFLIAAHMRFFLESLFDETNSHFAEGRFPELVGEIVKPGARRRCA